MRRKIRYGRTRALVTVTANHQPVVAATGAPLRRLRSPTPASCSPVPGSRARRDSRKIQDPSPSPGGKGASKLGRYVIRNDGVKVNDGAKQTLAAPAGGSSTAWQLTSPHPLAVARKHEQEPTTEVATWSHARWRIWHVVMAVAPPQITGPVSHSSEIF